MIIDMHVHTRFSPCSIIRIAHLIDKARKAGLDGVCITDHDTADSQSVFKNIPATQGICIIVGMEYTTRKGDFLLFGPVEYIPKGMDADRLIEWSKREGAAAIPAHPFRRSRPADLDILRKSDIIEGINGRNHPHENSLCSKWMIEQGNGTKQIGGSDAHTLDEIGRIVTIFDKNIYTVEDLLKELTAGKYSAVPRDSLKKSLQLT
jgi:predicted metal-dependent phosphoesterase TrpH